MKVKGEMRKGEEGRVFDSFRKRECDILNTYDPESAHPLNFGPRVGNLVYLFLFPFENTKKYDKTSSSFFSFQCFREIKKYILLRKNRNYFQKKINSKIIIAIDIIFTQQNPSLGPAPPNQKGLVITRDEWDH